MSDQWGLIPLPLGQQFDPAAPEQPIQPADIFGGFIAGWTAASPGTITGTMAATETGSDTFVASGDVLIEGNLSATETGNDVFAFSGDVLVKGNLAATETGLDTFTASGKVKINGTLAATETGNDTFAASGKVLIQGSLAATETGDDTFAATGEVISPAVFVPTKGGIPKAKTKIKKSEHEDIAAIVKREFDILDGTYQPEIVEQVKEEILPQIKEIDYSQYEIAVNQVNALIFQAKARVAQYEAKLIQDELDDEEALLMLL